MKDLTSPEDYFTTSALSYMCREIAGSKGREVLFCGLAGADKVIENVRVLSRGNDYSAPAIINRLNFGEVLIHNHPSGNLNPSDEDINIASLAGNAGAGFFIINNEADKLYVVVPVSDDVKEEALENDEVLNHFKEGSKISRAISAYEIRPEQAEMAETVTSAFNNKKIALIEAGTGVGKSMAYLVPSVLWAVKNSARVVISTNTINLQEQLIGKDIPLIHDNVCDDFNAVLVKGRNNYACRRKAADLLAGAAYLFEDENIAEEKALLKWIDRSKEGCRSDLNFVPQNASWEKISSETDLCRRARCSFYNNCFFYKARRAAAAANILVVNHHLLFADLALKGERGIHSDGAVLPSYSRVIIDEAHNIEDVATEYFGAGTSRRGFEIVLGRMLSKNDHEKGLLPFIRAKLQKRKGDYESSFMTETARLIGEEILPSLEDIRLSANDLFESTGYFLLDINGSNDYGEKRESKISLKAHILEKDEWKEIKRLASSLIEKGKNCVRKLHKITADFNEMPEGDGKDYFENQSMELKAYTDRMSGHIDTLEAFFFYDLEGEVKWVDLSEKRSGLDVSFKIAPVSIAESMKEKAYDQFKSAVFTSATLSVRGKFNYIKGRTGLDLLEGRLIEKMLLSPFDFEKQVFVGVPTDMPSPGEKGYNEEMERLISKALLISDGRAFVLFTSYKMMNDIYRKVSGNGAFSNHSLMLQGDAPRTSLLKKFRKDQTSVIFGSDSFWEGVDVSGDALMNVILTKLPFSVPDDPLVQARSEMLEKRGENAFMSYILPMAVLRFRQGFGRLIRNKTDRGAVLILDSRVLRKSYGQAFLKSLPKVNICKSTASRVTAEMSNFFKSCGK